MAAQSALAESDRQSVGYVMALPDGRQVYLELPGEHVKRDRGGQLLLRPAAVKLLDEVRAVAMRDVSRPSPAYLVTLREALDMTQEAFGEALGVDKLTVSRWERGTRRPGPESVRKIGALREAAVRRGVQL